MAFRAERAIGQQDRAGLAPRSTMFAAAGAGAGALLLVSAWFVAGLSEAASFLSLLGASMLGTVLIAGASITWIWRHARTSLPVSAFRGVARREAEDAATIAHDLRAPLATVNSYLDLLAHEQFGPMPEAALDAARRAALASTRLQQVVEATLLHEVRAAAGEPAPAGVADLNEILAGVLASLATRLEAAGAEVTVAPLPTVSGDSALLFRVFQNLVENALKYHQPGEPPRIAVSASLVRDRSEVIVRDYGVGIPQEDRRRVFERRARSRHGARTVAGHGVGLANVRRLVEEMGGEAWIDPTTTRGVAVRVSLPLA